MDERRAVVIGGGPAGASAAFFLKHADPDLDVLLIDRLDPVKYRRYHRMCGEAISEAAFKELSPLGPTSVTHRITRAREEWPGGWTMEARTSGYILDRPAFLTGVLDRYRSLGGEMIRDAVVEVAPSKDGALLSLTSGVRVRARSVIAADGARSIVRRSIFNEEPPVMLWADQFLVGWKSREDTMKFVQGARYRGGYRWEFPSVTGTRIGFPRGTDSVDPLEVVEWHRRAIPMGGLRTVVQGNIYLTGDAAGMTNPLTAGGIRVAMVSGRKAAEAVVTGDPASYQRWWSSSPYSSPLLLRAFRKLEGMSDGDLQRASKGFRPDPLSLGWVSLTRPEFRDVYRAYGHSNRYGW